MRATNYQQHHSKPHSIPIQNSCSNRITAVTTNPSKPMSEGCMFQVLFSQYLISVGKEYSNPLCARTHWCTHARAQWCTIL